MHNLGVTRSSYKPTHLLQTPDTFVRTTLPGMKNAVAIVHAAPQMGAGFTQYTAEFEAGGMLGPTPGQRFVYVLEGALEADGVAGLIGPGGYAYFPEGNVHNVAATEKSCVVVIEKRYVPTSGVAAGLAVSGNEKDVASTALMGDEDLRVQTLIPDQPQYDFAVNLMTYQPGAALGMVEIHVMEHGLLMLEGGGIYRLGDEWLPVTKGDFIWMAPYCPQWFGALGKTPAKYLIYKDTNRHPLGEV
ncbi:MAG: (S)-ureidoglycine aminohydrolase [Edaphobacter sp.]|uniref:(S)-ureidoglycine aminohydrolase n=1 Tax=Edaphobacter sp. TaxID=1934404 RepID=UPI0023847E3A|nr:(S)-ureidoglycine aminohydrolase [Edaphobacter sp.]MDE1177950.1 (S)-ureidoglycine aminohydrolase [Edaphobacter sp.]